MSSTVTATVTNAKGPAQRSKGGGRPAPSRPQAPSRAYDHLYDPVYHVSGSTVHNRNVGQAIYSRTVSPPPSRPRNTRRQSLVLWRQTEMVSFGWWFRIATSCAIARPPRPHTHRAGL